MEKLANCFGVKPVILNIKQGEPLVRKECLLNCLVMSASVVALSTMVIILSYLTSTTVTQAIRMLTGVECVDGLWHALDQRY
jgi:hypothetical protein